ncbi:AraC family transcriptional regulator [Fertoebacter nigrum]|uniref:AraC family transcriptional regulator n=1 Tax=Fertoeibacter niger TaxID=2656921 RepID=A0A8X8GUW4_9RHOB|nr:AraC family transcriptional regulator [Fertoeibacter niger]NUB44778.1 AraC family transcriptional regulator [Fertoeibacter niger]
MGQGYEKRMLRVVDHIHDHPTGDLSLDALADVAALSRFHFHRIYRAMTGETAAQTVRRMRLHRAAVALVQGKAPLARIARDVGYPNATSFTRAFTEAYAMPPAAFRKRGELRPFPPTFRTGAQLMYPVTIRHEPARHLAALPHTGPYPEIGRAFEKLFAALAARDLLAQTGYMVGVYYDDPSATPAADLRSHAGVEFASAAPEAPLESVTLPAGRHAVLTFTGPYAGLPAAYDQLYALWLPESGEIPADSPPFEIYRNSPMDTPQEALITEICLPLR